MKNLIQQIFASNQAELTKIAMCTHIAACAYLAGMAIAAGCEMDLDSVLKLNRHNCGLFTDAELTAAYHTAVVPLPHGTGEGNNTAGT